MGSKGDECRRENVGGEGDGDGGGSGVRCSRSGGENHAGNEEGEGGEKKTGDRGVGRYGQWVVGLVTCTPSQGFLLLL